MSSPIAGAINAARASAASTNPLASLRGRLILVTTMIVATASLMAVGLLDESAQRQKATVEEQLGETARALSLAADGAYLERRAVMRTLAAAPSLATGDLKSFEGQANISPTGLGSWVILLDPQGKVLIDNARPNQIPSDKAVRDSVVGHWPNLAKKGEALNGVYTGNGHFIFHLDHLVKVKGVANYHLVLATPSSSLQSLFTRQDLPKAWHSGIISPTGMVIAENSAFVKAVGQQVSNNLIAHLKTSSSGVYEQLNRLGYWSFTAYNRSPVTGWTVVMTVPRYLANVDLVRSLQWLSIVGAGLVLLGGGLTLWFMRSVARAVSQLEHYADSIGRGEVGYPPPTGLRETDFIGSALGAAAERLQARELELEKINQNLEVRVREASAQLVQSQKIEVIGRLTGGVAHDFNNLLTAVIGNLELLRRKVTDERQLQFVHNARSAADRGAKLTAQLLAFARKQSLTPEPVDVNELIRGMGELLASSLGRDRRLETLLDPCSLLAMADRTQLEMVLLNLVINARDAMPDGGVVEVISGSEHVAAPSDMPEHPPVGDFVRITVSDNGVGMAHDVLERAFEPFFTTKPPGRGSGLGLPQVLGVVQQLGGGVRIESHPGQGSRVHVYLPVAHMDAPPPKPRRMAAVN
ncbi:MAG TPA: ATP-binding protein [Caulobacteraceae bacterium]|nr:ATP-binding protein [Caulobacteraceae bacterium]